MKVSRKDRPFGRTFTILFTHGGREVLARDGIQSQFDSARNAELLVDRAEIVSNRMLGEAEFLTDVSRAQSVRQQVDDFRFPGSQAGHSAAGFDEAEGFELSEELQDKGQIPGVGPDLAFVDGSNAFGQQFDGLHPAKNAPGAASKGVHDQPSFGFRN